MIAFAPLAQEVVARLAWTSLQASLLVGIVWLINRQLPRLSSSTRSLLWWLLSVQLLLGLLLPTPVALPLLSPQHIATTTTTTTTTTRTDGHTTLVMTTTTAPTEHRIASLGQSGTLPTGALAYAAESTDESAATPTHTVWSRALPIVLALWLAGVLVQLIATFRHWREARAVVRASRPLEDPALQALCAEQARTMGLRRCPSLRVSHAIRSPQVSGLWRPVVLLPANQNLSTDESALALAHELTHLRRGDLWMGWAPGIAQRLFFFHPMVSWAMREYALNREAACDAQVVHQHDAAPHDYGRLLLRLGVAHPLHAGLAGASPTFHNLKRRLTLLQLSDQDTTSRLRSGLIVVLVAAMGVLPYRVTEAKADAPSPAATSNAWTAPATPATPATPVTPATPLTPATPPTPATPLTPPTPATPPTPPTPVTETWRQPPPPPAVPPAPKAPPAPPAPPVYGFTAHHIDIETHDDAAYGFALLDKDTVVVNGTDADLSTAKSLRGNSSPLVMFRRGGNTYLIRDKAYVDRAKGAYETVTELAREQGRLSGEQGRLSGQMAGIGARDSSLAVRLSSIAQRESDMLARQALHPSSDRGDSERADFAKERAELEHEQAGMEKEQQQLEQQQQALSERQRELSRRQQDVSTKATEKMIDVLDDALAKGAAQPIGKR